MLQHKPEQRNTRQILETILKAIALVLVTSIFLKAFIDIDTNYDTGWYQLPFAARIWGIVPEKAYLSENIIEHRYDGFPLLANFLQGLLWKVTGRIQATNLVGYLSLIGYFFLLKNYFQVPLYLCAIALFTIPAVLTHSTTSFVDLPGNIGVSVVMMMTYILFKESRLPKKSELLLIFLGAAAAANIKPQLQPLVFLLYWIVGARLLWLYFRYTSANNRRLWLTMPLSLLASALIFATPIKNVALYGNPFYPIKIEVAGIVLNHQLTPETYSEGNRPQKWLRSILEIDTPNWSADQYNQGNEKYLDRAGGFFGIYVVFNLLLLLGLAIREQLQNRQLPQSKRSRQVTTALVMMLLVSLVPANFPQSHELRYFMFWMITLVSLNLAIFSSSVSADSRAIQNQLSNQNPQWLQPKYLGLVCLLFMAIAFSKIDSYYLRPVFNSFPPYLKETIKPELLAQLAPNQRTCLIARHAISDPDSVPFATIHNAFYYSSYFHPEIKQPYGIKISVDPRGCGDLTVVPANSMEFIEREIKGEEN